MVLLPSKNAKEGRVLERAVFSETVDYSRGLGMSSWCRRKIWTARSQSVESGAEFVASGF